ncbi:MAG: dual specificity protein phosphatase family protein [Alphaproteobacteria bacterium]|nr:dual specificity protein phosphatase family protein [Alphaproteobacteria bacterium]
MKLFGKKKRKAHVAADLSTPPGRARAARELTFGDHGFLREGFQNLHQISHEMWRSNQPNPRQIEEHVRLRGIRTIINLRGSSTRGYYLLEKEACEAAGVELIDFQVFSRDTPTVEAIMGAKALFERIEYPALMHCKSGADRAGLMSALYMIYRQKQPVSVAASQLSKKYLHMREGKTGLLDAFFEAYLEAARDKDISFEDWVNTAYDRVAVKAQFLSSGKGRLGLDRLLRRE